MHLDQTTEVIHQVVFQCLVSNRTVFDFIDNFYVFGNAGKFYISLDLTLGNSVFVVDVIVSVKVTVVTEDFVVVVKVFVVVDVVHSTRRTKCCQLGCLLDQCQSSALACSIITIKFRPYFHFA